MGRISDFLKTRKMKPVESNPTPCSASSLLEEAAELLKAAAACERMGSPAHAKGYVRQAIHSLYGAEKALLNPSEIES